MDLIRGGVAVNWWGVRRGGEGVARDGRVCDSGGYESVDMKSEYGFSSLVNVKLFLYIFMVRLFTGSLGSFCFLFQSMLLD